MFVVFSVHFLLSSLKTACRFLSSFLRAAHNYQPKQHTGI